MGAPVNTTPTTSTVVADISMSPDDRAFLEDSAASTGAVIMGRRTFDFVDGPTAGTTRSTTATTMMPTPPPVFVVTAAPQGVRLTRASHS